MDALAIIARLGQGHLLEELADALQRTAEDCVETGQKGTVTLKLIVTSLGGVGDPMVGVSEEISRTAPKRKARGKILYSHEGVLHEHDPRQTEMDFRVVETAPAVVREA